MNLTYKIKVVHTSPPSVEVEYSCAGVTNPITLNVGLTVGNGLMPTGTALDTAIKAAAPADYFTNALAGESVTNVAAVQALIDAPVNWTV
jgi:hypothetical protein